MKKKMMSTLAVMMIATSAAALAAPARDEARPQEYAPSPEASYACCGGGEPEKPGRSSNNQ